MAITENMPVADIFMEKCYLSNGLILHSNPRTPLPFLFTDIFVRQEYTNPHIPAIKPNDVVIDIGASIGMFSLYAANSAGMPCIPRAKKPGTDRYSLQSGVPGERKKGPWGNQHDLCQEDDAIR